MGKFSLVTGGSMANAAASAVYREVLSERMLLPRKKKRVQWQV